jgi:hypothetical protein
MKYVHRLWNKAHIVDWYNSQPEEIRRAVYIEQTLGSDFQSNVHLCVNTKPYRTIVARIGKRGLSWFKLKPLPSEYINERYFGVEGLNRITSRTRE